VSQDEFKNIEGKLEKFKNNLLLFVILGIAIFVALSIYADLSDVIIAFSNFQWIYIPLSLSLTLINISIRFFKWHYYVRQLKIDINTKDSLIIFLSGLTMVITPAKLGEVFKSYLLKKLNDTEISKSVPIVFAERATDMIGLIILASIGFSAFRHGKELLLIVMAFVSFVILVIQSKKICLRLIDFISRIRFLSKFAGNFHALYESAYTLFSFKNLLIAVSISVISWFFECLALFFVLKGFGTDPSLLFSIFVFSFSTIAGVISMIPGGLGVAEGSMTGLFLITGIQKAVAVSATLIIRFCTLWFGVLIGLIALYRFRTKFTEYNNKLE